LGCIVDADSVDAAVAATLGDEALPATPHRTVSRVITLGEDQAFVM
jgi:hypothetical protein